MIWNNFSISYPASSVRNPVSSIKHQAVGFTLLEILIAIFIFAIVVTTILGSYNAVFSNAENIDESIDFYEIAGNCMHRMTLDLKSIYVSLPPEYTPLDFDDPPDPFRFLGDITSMGDSTFSRIRFTSLTHLPFGKSIQNGIAEIIYYVQETEDNNYVLRRSDSLYPYETFEEKGSDPLLCENLKSLLFTYYNQEGEKFDLWDSDSENFNYYTPKTVEIQLEIGDDSVSVRLETFVALPVFRGKEES